MDRLAQLLDAFRSALGGENVLSDDAAISSCARATFATEQVVPAIVRPASRREVQECVRIAREFAVPLYPVSRGMNWGYGSRVPVRSGCVLLDLGRMNRILEVDEELAYAVVEPGVTFADLHAHLAATGSRLFASVTGGPANASLVGNALERGLGKGPYGERAAAVCSFEIVLANGEVLETGFGRFPGARATHVARGSVGPYVDGLFTQSNFGIVTRMTVWLSPRPEHFQTFFYRIRSDERLAPLVDTLRELRLRGAIRTPVLLANDYRYLSFRTQYPWGAAGGRTPLPDDVREELKRAQRFDAAWGGDGALYSNSAEQARADRAYIERTLGERVDELEFWDAERARLEEARPAAGLARDPRFAFHESMMIGVPLRNSNYSTIMTYWRKKTRPPADMDPNRDGCGVLWYAPAMPARGADAEIVRSIVRRVVGEHGYEPNMGFSFATERTVEMTGALIYDREVEGEDERAAACHRELLRVLGEAGYYSYRLGIQSMDSLPRSDSYDDFLAALKRAVDPDSLIAPGRYVDVGSGPEEDRG